MYNTLISELNDGSAFQIQGVAVDRGKGPIMLSENGEHVPLVMSDNITCYVRSLQSGKYDKLTTDCSQLYGVTEEMAMVFFQASPKYTQESVIEYLRARLAACTDVIIKEHYTEKERILREENLVNSDCQFVKITFSYEYTSSVKQCAGLVCVC